MKVSCLGPDGVVIGTDLASDSTSSGTISACFSPTSFVDGASSPSSSTGIFDEFFAEESDEELDFKFEFWSLLSFSEVSRRVRIVGSTFLEISNIPSLVLKSFEGVRL